MARTSSRTAVRADGYVNAWYSVDGKEYFLGFFLDQDRAQNEIDGMLLAVQARGG